MYKIDCREEAIINRINKEEYKKSVKNDEKMKNINKTINKK